MWDISNSPPRAPCSHLKGSSASRQIAASALANTMDKGQSPAPRLLCRSQQKIEINCHVPIPTVVTMPHASRQEANYVAHTSPGWEHNRLHLAQPMTQLASPLFGYALRAQVMVADGVRHISLLEYPTRGSTQQYSHNIPEYVDSQTRCGQILQSFQPISASAVPYFPSSDLV
jgi:hypothetical protein